MRNSVRASIALIATLFVVHPAAAQDVTRGKQLFQTCAACHTAAADALGPTLKGVIGRKAGSLPGYRYSSAMQRSGLIWTEPNLKCFLVDPQATVPGNRMPYGGAAPDEADAIIKYLGTQK